MWMARTLLSLDIGTDRVYGDRLGCCVTRVVKTVKGEVGVWWVPISEESLV